MIVVINGYSKSFCEGLISNYISDISDYQKKMIKNFNEMDFKNANARDKVEDIVNDMVQECNNLITEINNYLFK